MIRLTTILVPVIALVVVGCGREMPPLPDDALVVTQTPLSREGRPAPTDLLDLRYPVGTRVALVKRPSDPASAVVLSAGLAAAGGPVLSPDGLEVLFVGRPTATAPWQIYRTTLHRPRPSAVTRAEGGAMDPAWLPGGRLVFASPVPTLAPPLPNPPSALFAAALTGGPPARLTFGLAPATDPTVLSDGRILFVSAVPAADGSSADASSLFTINNDGTEITAFAGQHDGPTDLRYPRESPDGRIQFLAAGTGTGALDGRIEQVLSARPFRSRSIAFPYLGVPCRAAEPTPDGSVLATLCDPDQRGTGATYAVYHLHPDATSAGAPIFDDPNWHDVEAVPALAPLPRSGRITNVDPARPDGILLCLDVRLTDRKPTGESASRQTARRIRILEHPAATSATPLGEVPIHSDGSFMASVPADTTLSLELLDDRGDVLRRCPPSFWVRGGENRACIGCHEPHNRAPDNLRPRAVQSPPVNLGAANRNLTHQQASR